MRKLLLAAAVGTTPLAEPALAGPIEEVVVRAHPLSAEGLAQPVDRLAGEALARAASPSIGETVARRPGVAATSFGPAVGRPVIHGLGGPRVRVMEDRISTLDASATSADHAVTVEPFLADEIEILKGPSTLVYGSGALGGVVDVHTGRIPHRVPEQAVSGRLEARLDDAAHQRTAALRLDGGSAAWAWHADGFTRDQDDYEIPGPAAAEADERDEATSAGGTLPGSDVNSDGGSLGASWVGARGFAGASMSRYSSDYGLPGEHSHAHEAGHGDAAEEHDDGARIDLEQTRWDVEAGLDRPMAGMESINFRAGINDYRHREREPSGAVGTTFDVEAWESRLELAHRPVAGWNGLVGLQLGREDFDALGEAAFTPATETTSGALFLLEERDFPSLHLELGTRLESTEVDPRGEGRRRFDSLSGSVGVVVPLSRGWEAGVIVDYASRAPSASELFANGAHLAARAFEIGDPELDEEHALNTAVSLDYQGERLRLNATAYRTRFDDFVHQAATGAVREGLPVRRWRQEDARFGGTDVELELAVLAGGPVDLAVSAFHDRVHGELDGGSADDLPRIPPERVGVGVAGSWRWLSGRLDYLRVMRQHDVAEFESPTAGYDDVRLSLEARIAGGEGRGRLLTVFVQGRNLTDDDQRNHVSPLKDVAPLQGRTWIGGLRARF
ncbi:MAG: TonB-dependent receptor [Pseudomonadota bacterium]